MKTKLLLFLCLSVPSLCFGKVTFKFQYWEQDDSNLLAFEMFDSSKKTKQSTGLLVFKKSDYVLLNTPENQSNLDKLYSFLDQHGLIDHLSKASRSNFTNLKFRTSVFNLDMEELFFFNGYTLNSYYRTEKERPAWERIVVYFFSKD
tara:strand:+ start:2036 stop:2476 length:441 start_codon:yes stop_codon:yes gene_type:complete